MDQGDGTELLLAMGASEVCWSTNGLDSMFAVDDPTIAGEAVGAAKELVAFGSLDT
jgi:hypothetical protein